MNIILVHEGNQKYLHLCLRQLKNNFPRENIFLIGKGYKNREKINYAETSAYLKSATNFEAVYKHLSNNKFSFELFCFKRWFIIYDFLLNMGKLDQEFMCIDSDVLLSKIPKLSPGIELANCRKTGPQYTYFRNGQVLKKFLELVMRYYEDKECFQELKKFYETKQSPFLPHGGNVCDMHLLGLFSLGLDTSYFDYEEYPDLEGFLYDNNLNESDGFHLEFGDRGIKEIKVQGKTWVGIKNGKQQKLGGLHFQGSAKKHMIRFVTGKVMLSSLLYRAYYFGKKALKKTLRIFHGSN